MISYLEIQDPSSSRALAVAFYRRDSAPPQRLAIVLHGGGTARKERFSSLASALAEQGLPTICFDHTGHGETGGDLGESSLADRLKEAKTIADALAPPPTEIVLIGFSMGGQTAVELATELGDQVGLLVLCAPAAYDSRAANVHFGPAFSEILRSPDSWTRSAVFEQLASFRGRTLLVLPETDDVIPTGVSERYADACFRSGSGGIIRLREAPHQIGVWLSEHRAECEDLASKIAAF